MSDDDRHINPPQRPALPSGANPALPEREEEILKFWEESRMFEQSLSKTRRAKLFVFYEGPPTANGSPGIHHFEARAFKDVIPRFKTMQGFFVARKAGWDTHGLPVEIQVEKELGLKSKRDIERYGVARFNEKCRESVWRYKAEWDRFTRRIGFWLDLEHPYITYETSYIESLWWIIKEFWRKNLLYRDFKVVPWCPRCETPLSTHELGQGYETVKDRAVYVKFYAPRIDAYILSWTTTPWTLPGNVGLAINPDLQYSKVRYRTDEGQEFYILAKDRTSILEKSRIVHQEDFHPTRLIGETYNPLFEINNLNSSTSYRVHAASFVAAGEGTGVVHTAVMYGEDDYQLGKRAKLPAFHTVDERGYFIKEVGEGLAGKYVKDPKTEDAIIGSLKRRGLLFKEEPYEHEYPFCWRCDTPLLYYAREAWWVKVSALKRELARNNETINWIPAHLKHGRFGEFVKDVRDWAFSRERYWGTPLPVWQCLECKHQEVMGGLAELGRSVPASGNRYLAIRHGQSEAQMLGVADDDEKTFHLTPKGRAEAEQAARRLVKENIDLIVTSPIQRTRETAAIVAKMLGVPVRTDTRLREIHIGIFEHRSPREYHANFASTLEKFSKRPPKGESLADLRARLMAFMADMEKKYRRKKILLVSHEYPIWILWAASQGFSDREAAAVKDRTARDFIRNAEVMAIPYAPLPRDDSGEVNLHRPFVDKVVLSCPKCRGAMRRVPDVVDVWFDSGAMPFAQHHYPFAFTGKRGSGIRDQNRKLATLPYPADYICEAIDQTRGWFYTLLAVSTLLGRGPSYRNVISLGHVLDQHGQKMSKSRGNIVDPWTVISRYGADAIRLYFYTLNAPGDPKRFDEADLAGVLRGPIASLLNSVRFFTTYVHRAMPRRAARTRRALDQWLEVRMGALAADMTERLEAYDVVGAARLFSEFVVKDFSNWYIRRSRRRLQRPVSNLEAETAAGALGRALVAIAELAAPFIPFVAEMVYRDVAPRLGLREASVHLRAWPRPGRIGAAGLALLGAMDEARRIAALALAKRAEANIRVRQPLASLAIRSTMLRDQDKLLGLIAEEVNVKSVVVNSELPSEILLDTRITPELAEEGMVREFIRNIQEMRRDAGLRPGEAAALDVAGPAEGVRLFLRRRSFLRRETGVRSVSARGARRAAAVREIRIGKDIFTLGIRKARFR